MDNKIRFDADLPRILHHARTQASLPRLRSLPIVIAGGSAIYLISPWTVAADSDDRSVSKPQRVRIEPSTRDLLRAIFVYSICSMPLFVDWAPSILNTLSVVPGINALTHRLVRETFFQQFVGGDTAEESIRAIDQLRKQGRGAVLQYSVEVSEAAANTTASKGDLISLQPHRQVMEEMIRSINAAAAYEDANCKGDKDIHPRRTWIALKLTALLPDASTLMRFSNYLIAASPIHDGLPQPANLTIFKDLSSRASSFELTEKDVDDLRELHNSLLEICAAAKAKRVKVMIDAEHSWYQPAIDSYAFMLMDHFNRREGSSFWWFRIFGAKESSTLTEACVYNTYQAYLRRTPKYIDAALNDAKREGYAAGFKLVRGAYHVLEIKHAHQHGVEPPVWTDKEDTDKAYDSCASILVTAIANSVHHGDQDVGVICGTHNEVSVKKILSKLQETGLAEISGVSGNDLFPVLRVGDAVLDRLAIGQLFGMRNTLADYVVDHIDSRCPMAMKVVPYGALAEVMPYINRRAIENKSIITSKTGAAYELRLVMKQLWDRVFSS